MRGPRAAAAAVCAMAAFFIPAPLAAGTVGLSSSLSISKVSTFSAKPGPAAQTDGAYRRADFGGASASPDARHIADWAVHSRDNARLPFVIIDKASARVFVFTPDGRLMGSAPALLGLARGDHTVPGIGDRELSAILPEERTTPAGRFVAESGTNHKGEDIVWIDYDAAVSMHRVRAGNPKDRRLDRLASATTADNRITFGCVNLPVKFYNAVVAPTFARNKGIVYVLPETRPVKKVFGSYDVREHAPQHTAGLSLRLEPRADSLAQR